MMMGSKVVLFVIFTVIISLNALTWDNATQNLYRKNILLNQDDVCSQLEYPTGELPIVHYLQSSSNYQAVNFYDMSTTNMEAFLSTARPEDLFPTQNKQFFEVDTSTFAWGNANTSYIDKTMNWQADTDQVDGKFMIFGTDFYHSTGAATRIRNRVWWLVQLNTANIEYLGGQASQGFDNVMIKAVKLTQILCLGRRIKGVDVWKHSMSQFNVYAPLTSFLNTTNHLIPNYYFHGIHCPEIPVRPPTPTVGEDCVWAIKLGTYFTSGKVEDHTQDISNNVDIRRCIQKVYGRRTHTLKCLYQGLNSLPDGYQTIDHCLQNGSLHTDCNAHGYTMNQLNLLLEESKNRPNEACIRFDKVANQTNQYLCRCAPEQKMKFDQDSYWTSVSDDATSFDWQKTGYECDEAAESSSNVEHCDELNPIETDVNSEYSKSCIRCRVGYIFSNSVCILPTTTMTLPTGCSTGKLSNGIVECEVCLEDFIPKSDDSGVCVSQDDQTGIATLFCKFNFAKLVGGNPSCLQCMNSKNVLRSDDATVADQCINTPLVQGGDLRGCLTVMQETVSQRHWCYRCAFGFTQVAQSNNYCSLSQVYIKKMAETVVAQRGDEISLAQKSIKILSDSDKKIASEVNK